MGPQPPSLDELRARGDRAMRSGERLRVVVPAALRQLRKAVLACRQGRCDIWEACCAIGAELARRDGGRTPPLCLSGGRFVTVRRYLFCSTIHGDRQRGKLANRCRAFRSGHAFQDRRMRFKWAMRCKAIEG